MNDTAPRRNSYQRLLEDNPTLVNTLSERWNGIVSEEGRNPTIQERLDMADQLGMSDARFYALRKSLNNEHPHLFKPFKPKMPTAQTALASPEPDAKTTRQKPSLPKIGFLERD